MKRAEMLLAGLRAVRTDGLRFGRFNLLFGLENKNEWNLFFVPKFFDKSKSF